MISFAHFNELSLNLLCILIMYYRILRFLCMSKSGWSKIVTFLCYDHYPV